MTHWSSSIRRIAVLLVVSSVMSVTPVLAQQAKPATGAAAKKEQFFPVLIYRTGPYAAAGSGLGSGYIDYLDMLNKRDGGVNGIKLSWEECETEFKTDVGVACYEKLKVKGATAVAPLATGLTYALIEKATADKIPLVTLGYGRSDASDGRVFPYVFPIVTNYLSQNSAKIIFISKFSGGLARLKGKKIAHLYHDSAYGKETIPILEEQAKKYGFEVISVPVKPPGENQDAEWQQIKQARPDWVILRGFGAMNAVALKSAKAVGFPVNRVLGVWWSGAEEDVIPAGDAARGFVTAAFNQTGADFPVIKDIVKHLYSGGKKGAIEDPKRIGSVYYNRGVIQGIIVTEALRTAQDKFGKRVLTGEEMRWGLENLTVTDLKINKLGAFGLMQSLKLSCADHEGGGAVKFQKWMGTEWVPISGWIPSDQGLVRPMIDASAAKYAKDKNITPRDCSKEK